MSSKDSDDKMNFRENVKGIYTRSYSDLFSYTQITSNKQQSTSTIGEEKQIILIMQIENNY